MRARFLRSDIFCFISISKIVSFKNPFATLARLLGCLNFILDAEDLFLWYKQKKWFLWALASAQLAENHGDEWGLTWYLWRGMYTSIPVWTTYKIQFQQQKYHGTSLDWEDHPNQHESSHKLCDGKGYCMVSKELSNAPYKMVSLP